MSLSLFYYYTKIWEVRCLLKKKGLFSWQFWRLKVQTAWCQLWWTPLATLPPGRFYRGGSVCERDLMDRQEAREQHGGRGLNPGVRCHLPLSYTSSCFKIFFWVRVLEGSSICRSVSCAVREETHWTHLARGSLFQPFGTVHWDASDKGFPLK